MPKSEFGGDQIHGSCTYRGAISWEGIWGAIITVNKHSGVFSGWVYRCAEVRTHLADVGARRRGDVLSPNQLKIEKI